MRIGIAGQSHLGLVTGAAATAKGFDVVAFDPDEKLIARLRAGEFPVFEPGLAETVAEAGARMTFTSDVAELGACDLVVVARDVPTDAANRSDVSGIERLLCETDGERGGAPRVVLSQVAPGFTRRIARDLKSPLYYQVETLIFGRAMERALKPERYIVGCPDPTAPLPPAYAKWLAAYGCPILPMRFESAELAKIAINLFLVSTVTTTNFLAEVCEKIGAEWNEIAPALKLDARIGPHAYLAPGLGLAGGNLERDIATVRGIAHAHGVEAQVVDAWIASSAHRKRWIVGALGEIDPPAKNVAVWGIAYKPGTSSTKNGVAHELLPALRETGVRAYDPQATLPELPPHVTMARDPLDACDAADVLVVATPWPAFSKVALAEVKRRMRGRLVIDPFGALDPAACRAEGLVHLRLGSKAEPEGGAQ